MLGIDDHVGRVAVVSGGAFWFGLVNMNTAKVLSW